MIPSRRVFVEGVQFLARRLRVPMPDEDVLQTLRDEAEELAAGIQHNEPAALYFAAARRARDLAGLWPALCERAARNQARDVGARLRATADELRELRLQVYAGHLSYVDLRRWFEQRLQL